MTRSLTLHCWGYWDFLRGQGTKSLSCELYWRSVKAAVIFCIWSWWHLLNLYNLQLQYQRLKCYQMVKHKDPSMFLATSLCFMSKLNDDSIIVFCNHFFLGMFPLSIMFSSMCIQSQKVNNTSNPNSKLQLYLRNATYLLKHLK